MPQATSHRIECNEARRLYLLSLFPLAVMAVLLAICLVETDFSIASGESVMEALGLTPLLTVAGLWLVSRERVLGWRAGFALLAFTQFALLGLLAGPLSYVAASTALPFQDETFARIDRLLCLDWPTYYAFVTAHPQLVDAAILAYAAFCVPPIAVPVALGLTGRFVRMQQFVLANILTICVVLAVSAVLPALGTYAELGLPAETEGFRATGYLVQRDILPAVRAGSLRVLDLPHLGGIITFPSAHAAAAILAIWGFWSVWWLRPVVLIVFGTMLLATPLVGGTISLMSSQALPLRCSRSGPRSSCPRRHVAHPQKRACLTC